MAIIETLKAQGWHLSTEGLQKLQENNSQNDIKTIIRKALDVDIRDIGAPIITSELTKTYFGPVVLQILKLKIVSASKAKPYSQTAPRLLKLVLTDGHTNCQAIEMKPIPALSLENTVPGTKLWIDGAQSLSGCILLDLKCCKVLGGNVMALVERWEISKLMPSHNRVTEDGPPAWVNFGKKIITSLNQQGFKSLENRNKENKEDVDFQNQRQDAISEVAQGAVKKVFGGGVKTPITFSSFNEKSDRNSNNPNRDQNANRASSKPLRKPPKDKVEMEKQEKPSAKVSLFDFLEDKLPASENPSKPTQDAVKLFFNPDKNLDRFNKIPSKYESTSKSGPSNRYQQNRQTIPPRGGPKYSERNDSRPQQFQNEKPPRFQKQKQDNVPKFQSNSTPEVKYPNTSKEYRSKPDTNNFINKLASEINNISLYNSKYEHEKLNRCQPNHSVSQQNHVVSQQNHSVAQQNNVWKWKTGDRCMAKYWEDNKYYNAVVTGVTNRTCMVEFLEYGNFEEVLHCDCIPIVPDDPPQTTINTNYGRYSDNQQISGNLEFRRGKNRPFVRNPQQKQIYGSNRGYET